MYQSHYPVCDKLPNGRASIEYFLSSIQELVWINWSYIRFLYHFCFLVIKILLSKPQCKLKSFHPRFKRFPALFYSSILALGCITLAFLKFKNWFIMKKQQPSTSQLSQRSIYNTQGKNPIIFNVKGLQDFIR